MKSKPFGPSRARDDGVSEVVGTLFLLVMTVAFFSVIMLWVYGFDTPEDATHVNLFPTMDRIDSDNANVSITHRGGEPLEGNYISIIISVQNDTYSDLLGPYTYQNGSGGLDEWTVGGTWSKVFTPMPEDAQVDLRVIDIEAESVLLTTQLQRGRGTGADAPPILGVPIVLPDDELITDSGDSFYLQAVAVDYNNDLPTTGVTADLTPIWAGLGTVVLEYKGFDTYRSAMINVPPGASPGKKSILVTATDSKGFTDTNYATCTVKTDSEDNTPPLVIITSPTSGEIAAGRIKHIAATYTDEDGIDKDTLILNVWEDGVPLDTSTKVATDMVCTFKPFAGFQVSSLYHINVSIEDNTGLRGYAEMLFRVGSYSQPGNPRGETAFDVMDRNWTATTVFNHDDLLRIQVWSAIIPRIDDSEVRLTKSDASNVYLFKDRFITNLSVPQGGSNPYFIYDATIDLATDGTYGSPIEPGYYALLLKVSYHDNNVNYINQLFIMIKYSDGSDPDVGAFMTYNTTAKWTTETVDFEHNEHLFIQVVTEDNLEWEKWTGTPKVHYICTVYRAIVTIKEVYGDNILYAEIPAYDITYAGTGLGGHLYRMTVDLNETIGGGTFFSATNWYPIEVTLETQIQHIKFLRIWTTIDTAFQVGTQIRIHRSCDLGLLKNDILIFHEDDTSTEVNRTVTFGETLLITIQVWNHGEIHITNAEIQVWAISSGVALDYWDLTSDANFQDPNGNGMIDAGDSTFNYVSAILTWNTSRTGYDQATLENASIKVSVSIITPLSGGIGSDPILEDTYSNNEATRGLVEVADGDLTITDMGYVTPANVDAGIRNIVMDRLHFAATGGNVFITGINVTLTGSAQDSDVARVALYHDGNMNGKVDAGDTLSSAGKFTGGVWESPEKWIIFEDQSTQYLIVYDMSDIAVSTRTIGSSIKVITDVFVAEPGQIINPAFSYSSELAIIISEQNELEGVGSGPTAAFRDTYLIYALDLTAYNKNGAKRFEGSLTIMSLRMDVLGWANLTDCWLVDEDENIMGYNTPAATITFPSLNYTITAATSRQMYVVLKIKPTTAQGQKIGIDIDRTDWVLSSVIDSVDNLFSITLTTEVNIMSNFFEYKAGDPKLEDAFWDSLYDMNIGSTDGSVEVILYGITVSWDDPDKPQWVDRIYIDGELVFQATGVAHDGNGLLLYFEEPITLSVTDMSFRIEFNDQVIHKQWGMGNKWNDNNIYFDWHFWDDSVTNGGKYVEITGGPNYKVAWEFY